MFKDEPTQTLVARPYGQDKNAGDTMQVEDINKLLWQHDLMGTCCNQIPGMENEYWACADGIAKLIESGADLEQAIHTTFDASFWEDCLKSSPRQDRLQALLDHVKLQQGAL